jgi:hypothetical protein
MGTRTIDFNAFVYQQAQLDIDQATVPISGEAARTGGGHYPMAGHQNRYGIVPTGIAHRPCTAVEALRQFTVGYDLPRRNGTQGAPDALPEFRANGRYFDPRQRVRGNKIVFQRGYSTPPGAVRRWPQGKSPVEKAYPADTNSRQPYSQSTDGRVDNGVEIFRLRHGFLRC